MSLQFIAGGSGSGKTRYLYEKVIKESEEHPDIQYLFIVPEQYTMQTQKELVRLHPRHGLLNIDVLSFKRLAYRVFEDLGVQLPQVLDDMGKSMVIRKVAGKLKKELKLYGGHLEQPGFINQLKSQISELCQYGVSVEDLAMVEEETDRVLLKDKLGDLKTVSLYYGRRDPGYSVQKTATVGTFKKQRDPFGWLYRFYAGAVPSCRTVYDPQQGGDLLCYCRSKGNAL